ncbi:hypothetical protein CVT25_008959 [Psilocybe cyanescens]|uniref:AMP-dependent synthetase/ligase domain-containing protein n=1 Tax=Psilocybe cyanescens TaxID=93625 RepID=A0A409XMZ8_PSICY|nr:hypothetical protein CVT25_008959 [Psilocybe cyanescens]
MSQDPQIPIPSCTQGMGSKTFKSPPLTPYLSTPEIFDWHFKNSRHHPFYVYQEDAAHGSKITTVAWEDAVKAIYRIANSVTRNLGSLKDGITKPLVGLYCSSESLTYMLAMIGVIRAGFPLFLISDRTSPASLEHLIVKSGVTHILINDNDQKLSTRLWGVRRNLKEDVTVSIIPSRSELFGNGETEVPAPVQPSLEDQCLIIHSSGSTALPELNRWTHRMMHNVLWHTWYGEKDICGEVMSTPAIPMGGPTGIMQALFAASSGVIISGFPPSSPPPSPTLENVWNSIIATRATYGFIPHSFLAVRIIAAPIQAGLLPCNQIWLEDDDKVEKLAKLQGVMFAGAPLSKDVGDKLAVKGVNVMTLYGSSEAGLLNKAFTSKNRGMDWEWFTFHPLIYPTFRNKSEDGVGELVLKTGATHTTTRTNTVVDGVPAYATGDLLERHPTFPSLWRFVSRVTDQETIGAGGPKINVVALAKMIMTDPLISGAVLVSQSVGVSNVFGVIIEPAHNDFSGPDALEIFKANIWQVWAGTILLGLLRQYFRPTIERYNAITHDPARVFKSGSAVSIEPW